MEGEKLHISRLQMESVARAWCDTQNVGTSLIVVFQASTSSTPPRICTSEVLCQALHNHFYPPYYHQGLLCHWLQLQ